MSSNKCLYGLRSWTKRHECVAKNEFMDCGLSVFWVIDLLIQILIDYLSFFLIENDPRSCSTLVTTHAMTSHNQFACHPYSRRYHKGFPGRRKTEFDAPKAWLRMSTQVVVRSLGTKTGR